MGSLVDRGLGRPRRRDEAEAASLYEILEHQIVPLFYERFEGTRAPTVGASVKASLRSLGPQVVASRMVRDYVTDLYEPAAATRHLLNDAGHARARSLSSWKDRVQAAWPTVRVGDVNSDSVVIDLGQERTVSADVLLGKLSPADVEVQLVHGAVGPADELMEPAIVSLVLGDRSSIAGGHGYTGSFTCERAGRYGFTVRVVPHHPDLPTFAELGRVAWAVHTTPVP